MALGQISPAVGRGVRVCVGVIVGVWLEVGISVSVIVGVAVAVAVLVGEGVNIFVSTKGDGVFGISSGSLATEQAFRTSKAKSKTR